MRRAEMARRRKNLSEKRNEEEKVCAPTPHRSAPLLHPSPLFTPLTNTSSKNHPN